MHMNFTGYELVLLFFTYSFLGWVAETGVATIKQKDFRNRGFVSGPFCFIYGFSAIFLTITLHELSVDYAFLFVGSTTIATAIEWITGKTLEAMKQNKWWDYSAKRWNFDGYICVQYSLLWGLLGAVCVSWGNGFFVSLFRFLPGIVKEMGIWVLAGIGSLDILVSVMTVNHLETRIPRMFRWSRKLQNWTLRLGNAIAKHIEIRIEKAYPESKAEILTVDEGAKQEHCGIFILFWLFFIGAFLGDLVETVFCRLTSGVWMSRSSLVWGPFSIVWGLALALATALLYRDRDKPDRSIFLVGAFLGGAYEYICSIFTEIMFGKVFWDYSEIPFNLGGRINLLYCFFWGIAAVIWIKNLYPLFAGWIEKIRKKTGRILTVFVVLFMIANMVVSFLALIRYDSRSNGIAPSSRWEEIMDSQFPNQKMERIYPNARNAE